MVKRDIGGKQFEFRNTLRVLYLLQDEFKCKTIQEVLDSLSKVNTEESIRVLYIACANKGEMSFKEFSEMLQDNVGIIFINNLASEIVDGLLYAGDKKPEDSSTAKNE